MIETARDHFVIESVGIIDVKGHRYVNAFLLSGTEKLFIRLHGIEDPKYPQYGHPYIPPILVLPSDPDVPTAPTAPTTSQEGERGQIPITDILTGPGTAHVNHLLNVISLDHLHECNTRCSRKA